MDIGVQDNRRKYGSTMGNMELWECIKSVNTERKADQCSVEI